MNEAEKADTKLSHVKSSPGKTRRRYCDWQQAEGSGKEGLGAEFPSESGRRAGSVQACHLIID